MTLNNQVHILDRFEKIVERYPDHPAVVVDGQTALTYRDLKQKALNVAAELQTNGAKPESVVALHLEKSAEYVAGVLGCWYAGAAFMPLDPNLPEERRDFILSDSGAKLVLSRSGHAVDLSSDERCVMTIETIAADDTISMMQHDRDIQALAYLIYTSGSTGTPKGVEVTHSGLVPMLEAQIEAFELDADSRSLFYLSTNFDASVSDMGTALLSGAALCIETAKPQDIAANLRDIVESRGITYMDIPPSLLRIMDVDAMPDYLNAITIGGEALEPAIARQWANRFKLINVYGPTEATICTSMVVCDPEHWDIPTIGKPLPGVSYRVVNADMTDATVGESGELLIGGPYLARGYHGRDDLNASKFITLEGERYYRSGDKVKVGLDQEHIFEGRIDRQVKIRGQLVELEEVEAAILQDPNIAQAGVIKRSMGSAGSDRQSLVGFVTPKNAESSKFDISDIRARLQASLSPWMIPSHIELLDEMPLTATGKINFTALADRPIDIAGQSEIRAISVLEAQILDIWKRVLDNPDIGPDDNYHDIGGDSLALVEISMAAEVEGLSITPNLVYSNPTVSSLAQWLEDHPDPSNDQSANAAISADILRDNVAFDDDWKSLIDQAYDLPKADDAMKDIFLTGATGFLASRLMHEILSHNPDVKIHALVRASDPEAGLKRIEKALGTHNFTLSDDMKRRIIPVCGDLTKPQMGLDDDQWQNLAEQTDTVIHSGAIVNMTGPYEALEAANINGTKEATKLALTGTRKRFHYVSTLSVFVSTDQNQGDVLESDRLDQTQTVYGGYGQTKWAAEYFVQQIPPDLCDISIHRLGLITGDTLTGQCSPRDFLHMFINGVKDLSAVPDGDASAIEVDATPVDYCAEAMRHIILNEARTPDAGHNVFHIANTRGFSLDQILNGIRWRGNQIDTLSPETWREKMEGMRRIGFTPEESAAYFAMVRMLPDEQVLGRHTAMDLFQATGVSFNQRNTQAALAGSRIILPPPNNDLLDTYLDAITGQKKEISRRGTMHNFGSKTGLVLGKFLPPHKGHQYLIDFACRYPGIGKLYVIVDRTENEPIPQSLRVQWIQSMFPDVTVLPLGDFNWQSPEEAPSPEAFWSQWERSLKSALPEDIDYCFNSENYGWKLAEVLGATHVPVDRGRDNFPISGTDVRKDPFAHWDFIPREVRPYFTKKVAIVGAESTGKSIIAGKLAKHFNTVVVPEYARIFLEALAEKEEARSTEYGDIEVFAGGQMASERSLLPKANRLMICDTEAITTKLWSETLYDRVPDSVEAAANATDYDLYILANADVPWVPDVHRQWEDESKQERREEFNRKMKAELEARGKTVVEITGTDFDDRFEQARAAIEDRIFRGRTFPDFGHE